MLACCQDYNISATMDFKEISPAVKIANIFVKFKKRDGVKITPLNLEFAAFDD